MRLQTQIDIDAPPERVWSVLTGFDRHPEWNPFIREISGEVREGARLRVVLGPEGQKPMTFTPVVTAAEPERRFAWRGVLLAGWVFSGEHEFRLETLPGGGTRFHHGETFGGLLLPLLKKGLGTDTRAGFEALNRAIKAEAERPAA